MGTLHQLNVNDNGRVDDAATAIVALEAAFCRAIESEVGAECSFAERERAVLELGNEVQRRYLERALQSVVDGHGDELLIDDELYRKHRPGAETYASLVGGLYVERPTFRQVAVRNGPTVVPVELAAGLVEGATPAMAYRIALGHAKKHSRDLEEDLRASHRVPPSRTKLEAIAKRIGTEAKRQAPRIESYLRQGEQLPEGAAGVSVGLDRTAVPMEEQRPEDAPPKTRRKKRTKPYERTPPAPVDVNYHMAYLGTVSITDGHGDVLVARRYAASPSEGPEDIVRRMMADVRNALRRDPALLVAVVQDGAPEMWNLVRPALEQQAAVSKWLEAIDRYHLNKRLGAVLRVIEPDQVARKRQLHEWNDQLDTDDRTIDRIERRIRKEMNHYVGDSFCVLHDNATFIKNNKDRMRYVSLRKAGLPVGSGVTEGACRSVIGESVNVPSARADAGTNTGSTPLSPYAASTAATASRASSNTCNGATQPT